MVMSLSRVLWKVHSKAPTVTASMLGTVLAAGEGYTTIRDSTRATQVATVGRLTRNSAATCACGIPSCRWRWTILRRPVGVRGALA